MRHQIDEDDVGFVPILKGQLSFHAAVVRFGYGADSVGVPIPGILLADAAPIRQFAAGSGEGYGVVVLSIGKPAAGAIVHHQMPFIPVALIVFINDSANRDERVRAVNALSSDLNGGTVRRQIRDLTDFLKV